MTSTKFVVHLSLSLCTHAQRFHFSNITCYYSLVESGQTKLHKLLLSSSLEVKCPRQSGINNQTMMQMAQSLPQTIIAFNQIEPCQNLIGNRSGHVKGFHCHCFTIIQYSLGYGRCAVEETIKSKFHATISHQ